MYFDTNESSSHRKAKEKLFDLIIQKRIEVYDQCGNRYEIFNGKYEDEFLHIESFVMDYSNEALFSNHNSPCIKHLESFKKSGYCDKKGYFGAFKELPCERCVTANFRKYVEGSSKFASYRPDVAFGFNGLHKVWLEIKNENPCSENKIKFCKDNDIVLLEISDWDVIKFKDFNGKLVFNKLEEYIEIPNSYKDIVRIIEYIKDELNKYRFIDFKVVLEMLSKSPSTNGILQPRNMMLLLKRIDAEFRTVFMTSKSIMNYFNSDVKCKAIISIKDYEQLKKDNIIQEEAIREIKVVEPSTSDRLAKCFKCKGKEHIRNLLKVEVPMKRGDRVSTRYYHNDCFNSISKLNT